MLLDQPCEVSLYAQKAATLARSLAISLNLCTMLCLEWLLTLFIFVGSVYNRKVKYFTSHTGPLGDTALPIYRLQFSAISGCQLTL